MRATIAAILYNFQKLIRFSGRDTRAQFWPYVIFLFIVQNIISIAIMIPIMINMITKMFVFAQQQAAKSRAPFGMADQRAIAQTVQGVYSDLGSVLIIVSPLLTGLFVVLIAAAVARRLHDRNMRGYWGLMPLPFTIVGLAAMPKIFATWPLDPDFGLFGLLFLNGIIHLAAVIVLIVLLAQRSTAGANRFGPEVTDWRYSP